MTLSKDTTEFGSTSRAMVLDATGSKILMSICKKSDGIQQWVR